jgi:hypothetical protein
VFVYIFSLKVAVLLSNFTVVEQQAVIFVLSEGVKSPGIYRRMLTQCGEQCMAQKNVNE